MPRYAEHALLVAGTAIELKAGTVQFGNDHLMEELVGAEHLTPDSEVVFSKRLFAEFSSFQPFALVPTPAATGIEFILVVLNDCSLVRNVFRSYKLNKCCVVPTRISGQFGQAAEFGARAYALKGTGDLLTVSANSATRVKVTDPYQFTAASVGGVALTSIVSCDVNYEFEPEYENEIEPTELFATKFAASGSINVRGLDKITAAMLTDKSAGEIVLTFTSKTGASFPVTIPNASYSAEISGKEGTISFKEITD